MYVHTYANLCINKRVYKYYKGFLMLLYFCLMTIFEYLMWYNPNLVDVIHALMAFTRKQKNKKK